MKRMKHVTVMFVALIALAGCVGPMPSATVTTASPAWQNWLKVSYDVETRGEQRKLAGYVVNEYGVPMRVQLLAQAVDTGEQVIAQKIFHLPGVLPGFGRSYFEVVGLPAAQNYRVTVWTFERIEGGPSGAFP